MGEIAQEAVAPIIPSTRLGGLSRRAVRGVARDYSPELLPPASGALALPPDLIVFEHGHDGWGGVTAFTPEAPDYLDSVRLGVRIYQRPEGTH